MKTIYIIDDDYDDVEILAELIKKAKPEVVCMSYRNPEDALVAIKDIVPGCIFLSISLPKVRGDDFLQELRQLKELNNTYIVVQAIDVTPDVEKMLLSHGADVVVEKPWSMDEYRNVLNRIFNTMPDAS